jgi:hypothetical protein
VLTIVFRLLGNGQCLNLRNLYCRYCIVYCFLPLNECFDRDYTGLWQLRRPCTSDMCVESEASECLLGYCGSPKELPRTSFHHQMLEFEAVMGSGMSTRCITRRCVRKVLLPSGPSIWRRAPFYRCVEITLECLSLAEPHLRYYHSATVPRQELKGYKGSFFHCLRLVVVVRIGFWNVGGVCTGHYIRLPTILYGIV